MTHAALQDLLPCPFCGRSHVSVIEDKTEAHLVVCEDCISAGPPEQSEAEAIAAWNRRAALSAMEGEAVAWQYRVKNEDTGYVQPWSHWDRGDRPEMIGRWKAEYRPLYTAPPPQQAEKEHRDANGNTKYDMGYGEPETQQSTHPTPSPGPQGGGDAIEAEARRLFANTTQGWKNVPAWEELHWQTRELYVAHALHLATPPQPEAQVTDAMVDRFITAFHDVPMLPEYSQNVRRGLTAALTTSGRDGDGN